MGGVGDRGGRNAMAGAGGAVAGADGAGNGVAGAAVGTIDIRDLWEHYRLYHDRTHSLKEVLVRFRRARYEDLWALRGVTMRVEPGEAVGVIGANGSGKSTLLKCVARVIEPSRGTVSVRGRVSALLELGAGFHPDLTGRENVFINGAMLGMTRREIRARFDDIVAFSELEQFIDSPVRTYSSGMYMRLGFSVAVHVDPDVLLVDEVLAVGDEQFQAKCRARIAAMKARGVTILFVSHDLPRVQEVCDRVVWLDRGVVRAEGVPAEVVREYAGRSE